MSRKNDTGKSSATTQRAAKTFTRRTLLQSAAAIATTSLAVPFFAKRALSSSGEVNVYAWSDYIWPEHMESFEKKTGIKVNLSKYGSRPASRTRPAPPQGSDPCATQKMV